MLIIMPACARFAMGLGTALFPYARPEGMGKGFSEYFSTRQMLLTLAYTALAAVLLYGWQGAVIFAVVVLFGYIFARFVSGRIGGLTGDVYGALSELSEVIALLSGVLLIGGILGA